MLKMLVNADIWIGDMPASRAGAMLIGGGRVLFSGGRLGAEACLAGRDCDIEDVRGATVLPGFNDAHMHALGYALGKNSPWLGDAGSVASLADALRSHLSERGLCGGWLQGRGWNQENFCENVYPTRADLDAVSTDVPILATRVCGHVGVLNGRAMEICGVGDANGLVREDELDVVSRFISKPSDEELLRALEDAQSDMFACGITSVQSDDLGYLPVARKLDYVRALRGACESGRIRVRYALQAFMDDILQLEDFLASGLAARGDGRFRVSAIKMLADGSLGARTAYMKRPYADAPETRGIAVHSQEETDRIVGRANAAGLPVAIHVIGDAAMEQALAAFEKFGTHPRNAVVHAQVTDYRQLERCGRLGLVVMAQPVFLEADAPILAARVGAELARTSYRWKTMRDMGAHVALSTDCPVEKFTPLRNMYFAMRRKAPGGRAFLEDEAFTAAETVHAYSAAGAYASGEEAVKGTLQAGMAADYVVLDKRWSGDAEELPDLKVARTVIGGETVYDIT